jgi:tetratricopeptide (TPR) repeat protein
MRQGDVYAWLKEWAQAEEAFKKAVEARPNLLWPYLNVGHMRRNIKDYEGALVWYHKAEELAPDKLAPKYHIGYVYYLKQDCGEALNYF